MSTHPVVGPDGPAVLELDVFEDDPWPDMVTVVAKHPNGEHVGWLEMKAPENGGREIDMVEVQEDFLRQGVATAMWNFAKAKGLQPRHSKGQSDEGMAWAATTAE